jgi:hypothetical protein
MASWPHSEYVFHHNGRYIESGHFHRDVWDRARKAAGLPDLWFHDLRHAAPTIMAAAGWGPKKVQLELGHHSASFTLDRYGHLFAEEEDSARTTLNSALEQAIAAAKDTPGGTRTHTPSPAPDLESGASTVPPLGPRPTIPPRRHQRGLHPERRLPAQAGGRGVREGPERLRQLLREVSP